MVRAVERGNTDTGEGSVTLSESEHCRLQPVVSSEHSQLRVAESGLGVITTSRVRRAERGQMVTSERELITLIWSEAVCVGLGSED